jgi:hypothetical protein
VLARRPLSHASAESVSSLYDDVHLTSDPPRTPPPSLPESLSSNLQLPPADVLSYASALPKRKRRKRGRLVQSDLEAVEQGKEQILRIVEDLDTKLQLGGPDGVWRAMGLTKRKERSSHIWNAFEAQYSSVTPKDDLASEWDY